MKIIGMQLKASFYRIQRGVTVCCFHKSLVTNYPKVTSTLLEITLWPSRLPRET